MLSRVRMKLGLLVLAAAVIPAGCVPLGESTGDTVPVCTSRNARGWCTHHEERESDMAQWLRAASDERAREEAYRKGELFFPSHVPGETLEHYGERLDEDRRRLDAYRKDEAFFPDNRAGESPHQYLQRLEEDRRRGEAYRKGGSYTPPIRLGK
jgi:hypothetical protein